VPHDWLFRHVKAVVHHGGAGTLAAGICAGLPTRVVPFGGDQPFWANRVRQMGIGPKPIPRNRLTPKRLAKGLQELVSERRFRVAAKELGLRLAMEDGVANAANIIEHELRKYLREENLPPVLVKTAEM
jgi:UDP:flavonoid glycosyltransferase YjiC (YdhE family)